MTQKSKKVELLKFVLLVKIAITLILWALPFLLPDPWLDLLTRQLLGIPPLEPKVFIHLLGAAFLALVVGYISACYRIEHKKDVGHILWVGIVSNALASFILFLYGFIGAYQDWLTAGQIIMWGSAIATGLITLGLIITKDFEQAT
jgi:hypothetical protein